jgi:hypothetical protein
MKTSTRNEPDDRDVQAGKPAAIQGKAKTAVRCRLCRETIELESNFRPTRMTCPHCGLEFIFDPQQEPLPVRGLRLRHSAVLEAQQYPGTTRPGVHLRRHPAHVRPVLKAEEPKAHYLAWAGGLALSLAAGAAFFSGWFHRLPTR